MIVCGVPKCRRPMTSGSSEHSIYKYRTSTSKTFVCPECYEKAKDWQKAELPPKYHKDLGYFKGDVPR